MLRPVKGKNIVIITEGLKNSILFSYCQSEKIYLFVSLPERGMLTKVLLPDFRLVGAVGVPIRVNYGPTVKTLRKR